jgi:hypothetical protein
MGIMVLVVLAVAFAVVGERRWQRQCRQCDAAETTKWPTEPWWDLSIWNENGYLRDSTMYPLKPFDVMTTEQRMHWFETPRQRIHHEVFISWQELEDGHKAHVMTDDSVWYELGDFVYWAP